MQVKPSELLTLSKLVAASENECARATGGARLPPRSPLMTALLSLLKRLLVDEMAAGTRCVGLGEPAQSLLLPCGALPAAVQREV